MFEWFSFEWNCSESFKGKLWSRVEHNKNNQSWGKKGHKNWLKFWWDNLASSTFLVLKKKSTKMHLG